MVDPAHPPLSTSGLWHARFKEQLDWTSSTRNYVYRKLNFASKASFLELGCGTGVMLDEMAERFLLPRTRSGKEARLVGIDSDSGFLEQARANAGRLSDRIEIEKADAQCLPYPDNTFDVVYCHYFLMWNGVQQRANVLAESRRVLKDGGWFVALAEPDYIGWILEPPNRIRELLIASIEASGGDPASGRRLAGDLSRFLDVTIDCCSKVWTSTDWQAAFDGEWRFYRSLLVRGDGNDAELARLKAQDEASIGRGNKFSFLPVIFGFGRKSRIT